MLNSLRAKIAHTKINYRLACLLANCGVWVKSGGYYWRNKPRFNPKRWKTSGQYQSYGEYPQNIRGCYRFDLKSFKSKEGWTIWIKQTKKRL
jgi:hypothetical protein